MTTLNIIFVGSLISNFFLLYILSKKKYIFFNKNRNKQIRWGNSKKSHYGGLSFFITFIIIFVTIIVFDPTYSLSKQFIYFFFVICIISVYGLLDEKFIFKPKYKLLFQILISYILIKSGVELKLFFNEDLNFVFNLFWYLFLFNALNMVDNIDLGYFASIFPSFLFFSVSVYFYNFDTNLEFLTIVYFAGLLIFFLFNRFPSKIFLGEIGSAQITAIAIILSYFFIWKEKEFINHQTSLFDFLKNNLFFIFIFNDFLITFVRRIYLKKSIYLGDTNHISHNFTKIISVNFFALYVICLGILSMLMNYIFENYLSIANWQNISYIFAYYIFILIVNFLLYLYCLKKNAPTSKI